MKAAQINDYGDAGVLVTVDDVENPRPAADQVLVSVKAAGVNPFDSMVRSGYAKSMAELNFPATLGGDAAGVVAEVGEAVTGFAAGDEVYGQAGALSGQGSFAEFTIIKAEQLAKKPTSIDFVQAAALPLVGASAIQALVDTMDLQKDQKILIHGGAGGIGSIAIQLAKHLGAQVATTAATKDVAYVKELGADEAIDYTAAKFEDTVSDYDAVFDTVGGDTFTRSFTVLKEGGKIVTMSQEKNVELAAEKHVTATNQFSQVTTERLAMLAKLADDGIIKVHVEKVFPLDQAGEALAYRETEHPRGKVVIQVQE